MFTKEWLKKNWWEIIEVIIIIIMAIIIWKDNLSYKFEIERCWKTCQTSINYTNFNNNTKDDIYTILNVSDILKR